MPLTPEDRIRIQNEEIYKAEQEEYRTEVRNQIRKDYTPRRRTGGALLVTLGAFVAIFTLCIPFPMLPPVRILIAFVPAVIIGYLTSILRG